MPTATAMSAQEPIDAALAGDLAGAGRIRLGAIIEHLGAVVEEETAQLRRGAAIDLKAANDRKSQALLELTRALRQVDQSALGDPAVQARLAALRQKLASNQAVLKLHLDAVREVSNIVCAAIRHADSDGTYSPAIRQHGPEPWCD
ncbi:MAG TPA: hypothetical protein VN523_07820 [Hyphomicrobiaceae bacterium]|jgi:hypothetical protein|nr:hypothetical protein [Hyphomicrobiaceae bacterium]